MAVRASRGPAAVGFRRDVTFFLSALVGFLIILILVLLLMLRSVAEEADEVTRSDRARTVDVAAREINALDTTLGSSAVEAALIGIRSKLGIDAIVLDTRSGDRVTAGTLELRDPVSIERATRLGPARFVFDQSEMTSLRRRLYWATAICLGSAMAGAILLLLYVRRIARPIEAMLEQAAEVETRDLDVEETSYLIETFRSTIDKLRKQETELKGLHEREKARADDLERVTATLTRSLTSGFLALDPSGRLVDVNDAARDILALDSLPIAGRTPVEALGDTPFARAVADAAAARIAVNRTEVDLDAPGAGRTIGLSTVPLVDESSRYLGLLALFTDLTPIRRLETRLREMQTLADLGEISAGIAHEFRNSLSTILGYLKLARRHPMPSDAEAKVRAAEQEAITLGEAVTALLHFAGPMQIHSTEIDLRSLLDSIVERLRERAGPVRISLQGEGAVTSGDPALLARAFENVLRNAIEAVERKEVGGSGGTVAIRVEKGRIATVTVHDDGVGIATEDLAWLFLPFRTGRAGGFGLGLALTRKIVLLHEGAITIRPRAPAGTEVRIELPGVEPHQGLEKTGQV